MYLDKQTASLGKGLKGIRDMNLQMTNCTADRGSCLWNLQDFPQLHCHINIDDALQVPR
jgi:hypothetical protein